MFLFGNILIFNQSVRYKNKNDKKFAIVNVCFEFVILKYLALKHSRSFPFPKEI